MGLIIFILCANQALASEWILYEKSATGDEYYDKSSIQKVNNNIHRVRIKKIYNDVGKYKKYAILKKMNKAPVNPYILSHELILVEVDCLHKKIKISSERICDKRGAVIASKTHSPDKWMDIVPNSKFQKIKVCAPLNHSKIKKK
jgi:hypothetical protein